MKKPNLPTNPAQQGGFTLVEILVSIFLMSIIVLSADQFIAGVVHDRISLAEQKSIEKKLDSVLGQIQANSQNALFIPLTNLAVKNSLSSASPAVTLDNTLQWPTLSIGFFAPKSSSEARDCNNTLVTPKKLKDWSFVQNTYTITSENGIYSIFCKGNGDPNGQQKAIDTGPLSKAYFQEITAPNNALHGIQICLVQTLAKQPIQRCAIIPTV